MGFPDFPMPSTLRKSYIESGAVLSYLQTYANHFKIVERIRFRHYVIRVRPVEGSKWEVSKCMAFLCSILGESLKIIKYFAQIIVKDLLNNKVNTLIYDAVFVCNGNLNTPAIPKPYPGEKLFRGKQIHSHNFRRKEAYEGEGLSRGLVASNFEFRNFHTGKNVLLIGAGASGRDLSYLLSSVAKRIYFSHHGHNLDHVYPSNVVRIAAVKELTETGAIFADGSQHELDNIIYCTGYKTAFPFLNVECGISVDQNYVQPLYKDILNINHPTMAFMGLTYGASLGHTLDLQARFMLKVWSGEKSLPSIDDMKADTQRYKEIRRAAGFPQKKYHVLFGINVSIDETEKKNRAKPLVRFPTENLLR